MKKPGPREGFVRPGPGEQIIRPGPGEHETEDVEGHGINSSLRRPIEAGIPGVPGSDGVLGLPRTGGEATGSDEDEDRTR